MRKPSRDKLVWLGSLAWIAACGGVSSQSGSDAGSGADASTASDAGVVADVSVDRSDADAGDARTTLEAGNCGHGELDDAFGDGGIAIVAADGGSVDVAYQPDGKIVVAGTTGEGLVLARLGANGVLDATFGSGGFSAPIAGEVGVKVVVQSDGKAIVIGAQGTLARYTLAGALDATFGSGGVVSAGHPLYALALAPDGRIVVGGADSAGFEIMRFAVDGSFDPAFGTNGVLQRPLDLPSCKPVGGWPYQPVAVAAPSASDVVFATFQSCDDGPLASIAVATANGIVGPGGNKLSMTAFVVQDGGAIVGAGDVLARFLPPDFSTDDSFGDHGLASAPGAAQALRVDSNDGLLFAGGPAYGVQASGMLVARYGANGSLDPTFGDAGVVFTPLDASFGVTGADLRGCGFVVTGFAPSFAVAKLRVP